MHISPEPHVIGQVPANVIRIVIDHDLVRVPQPSIAEGDVRRGYVPRPSVEPETRRAAACDVPHMARAKAAAEMPMLPGVIQVIVRIILPRVMSNPMVGVIDMRSIRMSGLIRI